MSILSSTIETNTTVDGSLPEGYLFASFKNIGNQEATVNGVPLAPGEAKSYPFVGKGNEEMPYQTNGSTLQIMYKI